MKHLFYIILISIFFFDITTFSQNPEWINYTNGDDINVIEMEGDFVWVGTDGGLVKINRVTGNTIFFDKTNSGLPSNFISCIAIDEFGNKWIGTSEGLVKFNGTEWIIYNASNSGLRDNYIQCIAIDKLGNKWIGNGEKYSDSGGLIKFDGTDWTLFTHVNSDLPSNGIICISIDKSGNKWIGTNRGLAKFDGADNWTIYDESNSGLPDLYISCIDIDESGNTWVGTEDGLAKFNGTDWIINLKHQSIECITIDKSDNVWIGRSFHRWSDVGGLVKFDGTNWEIYDEENTGLPGKGISRIAIDEENNKWIGYHSIYGYEITYGKGLVKYDDITWTKINTSSSGLPNNQLNCIAIDKLGNKWIGTEDRLAKFDGTDWIIYDESNSELQNNHGGLININCIAIDKSDTIWSDIIWVGTGGGGIVLFDDYGPTFDVHNTSNSGILSDHIWCIAVDNYGVQWIGTHYGLTELYGTNYTQSNSELPNNGGINCVAIDESNNKWIGTNPSFNYTTGVCSGGGLAKFDGTDWDIYNKSNSGLTSNDITCIAIDDSGNKWIGTRPGVNYNTYFNEGGGLAKFDGTNWTIYDESNSGLPDDCVNCIAIDIYGNKWIGTYEGLVKFDGTNWTIYDESNSGLPSNSISCIAIDEVSNKWIGTYEGLAVFNEGGVVSVEGNSNEIELLPSEYVLYQNYPNPFNPSTTIKYEIPSVASDFSLSNVTLKVYDILGREVATLVNEQQKAGYYEVNWDAGNNSSGIYFYHIAIHSDKLNAGSFVETKKMILLH